MRTTYNNEDINSCEQEIQNYSSQRCFGKLLQTVGTMLRWKETLKVSPDLQIYLELPAKR